MTDIGRKYLLDHAAKGFKLDGVFIKGLHIEAKKSGARHNKKIDINYSIGSAGGEKGLTNNKIDNKRLQINIEISTHNFDLIEIVECYSHETFLHGDLLENTWIKNNGNYTQEEFDKLKTTAGFDHSYLGFMKSFYGNGQNYWKWSNTRKNWVLKTVLTNTNALSILQNADKLIIKYFTPKKKPHSSQYLTNKILIGMHNIVSTNPEW